MRLHPKAARSDTHLPYTMLFPAARVVAVLARARASGAELVFVLGEPAYYRRFGFRPAAAFGIAWEHPAPPEAFMAVAPGPGGALVGPGVLRYHPIFDRFVECAWISAWISASASYVADETRTEAKSGRWSWGEKV